MYIMYIDESGDTIPLSNKGKQFLVLTGCIIYENDKVTIEKQFRTIKEKYYDNPDIEIKSNFLRYANPDLSFSSPIKLHDRKKYDELETAISTFLKDIPITLCSTVIDKSAYWQDNPAKNPYEIAYILLLEQFQLFLEEKDSVGVCIIDPREGQVNKTFIGLELDRIHHSLRWDDTGLYKRCPNIIERLLFATSDKTIGIQIADLFCYPILHIFEYQKKKGDYWRYKEITFPKFFRKNNQIENIGLTLFPDLTKKGLKNIV